MNIDATLYGQFVIIFALVMAALCYYLGRRKTQNPVLAGLLGAVLSLLPLFGLVYLMVLLFKKDLSSTSASKLDAV
ncbi:glycosyltransferase 87 family protein [Rheinheimera faecalis]|uniref:glycosyltransferase 87 family protein n=1 Tax=Rheinheimera faecalis TaxID=2901141 RepID=UPI001E49B921|nr:glycosyltransferase 87 family protein [Rheinheimera faecalis]